MNYDLAAWRASLTPDRPALWFNGKWYTYAELDQRARKLAARLHEAGVGAGDRVGILALNHLCHVDCIMAAPKLGFIYTPLNYRLTPKDLALRNHTTEIGFLLYDDRHESGAKAFDCPQQPLRDYGIWLDSAPKNSSSFVAGSEDIFMMLGTGGSTGEPKYAQISYRQVFANACATVLAWGLSESDTAVQATPAFHAAVNVLSTPLWWVGGKVVWSPIFTPNEYIKQLELHQATIMFMVPTMYQQLINHREIKEANLSSVRFAISGGANCPEHVRMQFAELDIRFKQGYGMTEAGVNCFSISLEESQKYPESVGRPMPMLEAVIRRPSGAPAPANEVGEITLRGEQIFSGYFRAPEQTRSIIRNGWLWTGDLGQMDTGGRFFIRGRRKEMYISGGENIYPVEIEQALLSLNGILDCAVLGVGHPEWGETGLACLVCDPDAGWTKESLQPALRAKLAHYKVPSEFIFMQQLPKSAAGKVVKPVLREIYQRLRSSRNDSAEEPASA